MEIVASKVKVAGTSIAKIIARMLHITIQTMKVGINHLGALFLGIDIF